MRVAWAVIWRGKRVVTYLTRAKEWSLDPGDAHVYSTWAQARWDVGFRLGIEVVRCWT